MGRARLISGGSGLRGRYVSPNAGFYDRVAFEKIAGPLSAPPTGTKRKKNGARNGAPTPKARGKKGPARAMPCPVCGKLFATAPAVEQHRLDSHREEMGTGSNDPSRSPEGVPTSDRASVVRVVPRCNVDAVEPHTAAVCQPEAADPAPTGASSHLLQLESQIRNAMNVVARAAEKAAVLYASFNASGSRADQILRIRPALAECRAAHEALRRAVAAIGDLT